MSNNNPIPLINSYVNEYKNSELYGDLNILGDLKNNIDKIDKKFVNINAENDMLSSQIDKNLNNFKKLIDDNTKKLNEKDIEINRLGGVITGLRNDLKKLEKGDTDKTTVLKNNITTLQNNINALKNDKKNLATTNNNLNKSINDLKNTIINLKNDLLKAQNELKNKTNNSSRNIELLDKQINGQKDEIDKLKNLLEIANTAKNVAVELQKCENEKRILSRRIEKLTTILRLVSNFLASLDGRFNIIINTIKGNSGKLEKFSSDEVSDVSTVDENEMKKNEIRGKISKTKQHIQKLNKAINQKRPNDPAKDKLLKDLKDSEKNLTDLNTQFNNLKFNYNFNKRKHQYKCTVSKNGRKFYYKIKNGKWARISSAVGRKAQLRRCGCGE